MTVIYARYSCEKQNDQSIESQLRVCRDFAEKNGLTIIDTYADRATTGTNDNRAEFQRMLADAEKPVLWDIVLVYAIDRFGRNSIEIALNKQKLKKNHKTLISATQRTSENIDGTKNLDGTQSLSMIRYSKCCAIIKKAAGALSQNTFCGKSSSAGCAVPICRAKREHRATEQSCTITNA